jgi:hypothetical protein
MRNCLGDDPLVLSNEAGFLETLAFEHRKRSVEQKGAGNRATMSVFRIAFYNSSSQPRDLKNCTCKSDVGDPLAAAPLAREKTGDPPIGKNRGDCQISAAVLDAR